MEEKKTFSQKAKDFVQDIDFPTVFTMGTIAVGTATLSAYGYNFVYDGVMAKAAEAAMNHAEAVALATKGGYIGAGVCAFAGLEMSVALIKPLYDLSDTIEENARPMIHKLKEVFSGKDKTSENSVALEAEKVKQISDKEKNGLEEKSSKNNSDKIVALEAGKTEPKMEKFSFHKNGNKKDSTLKITSSKVEEKNKDTVSFEK